MNEILWIYGTLQKDNLNPYTKDKMAGSKGVHIEVHCSRNPA